MNQHVQHQLSMPLLRDLPVKSGPCDKLIVFRSSLSCAY